MGQEHDDYADPSPVPWRLLIDVIVYAVAFGLVATAIIFDTFRRAW